MMRDGLAWSWRIVTVATAVARFAREIKAVGRLEHPNIIRAIDANEQDGTHYLVME